MTDQAPPTTRPRKASRKPSPLPVFATTAALFLGLFGLLGVRMAQGQDPSLGAKKQVAAVQQPRKVLVRKVVVTKKVTIVKPSSPQTAAASTPVTSTPAPAYTPPAQTATPAPAPAPAPAPVATSTS